jgi:hypothetical protein
MTTPRPKRPSRPIQAAAAAGLLPLALSLIPTGTGTLGATCGTHCGTQRWTIKTLTDPEGPAVFAKTAEPMTVSTLVDTVAPTAPSNDARASDLEKKVVSLEADLLGYKAEFGARKDRDFHIVIRDPANKNDTMVVEIPDPSCSFVCSSVARDKIIEARNTFAAAASLSPPSPTFVMLKTPLRIQVTGVPLFDFSHGQTGLAKNCIEIHPVLAITLPAGTFDTKPDDKSLNAGTPDKYTCIPE